MRFCPRCDYYFFYAAVDANKVAQKCNNCGHSEPLNPETKEDALVLETNFRSGSSAGGAASGITINAYTLQDPTLPHVKTISCRNTECPSTTNPADRDVIYIKTDPTNLKFQYVCVPCGSQWTN